MELVKKITFPTFSDQRGDLTALELKDYVDWEVKRVYYVTHVKEARGGHCVKGEKKIYVMMKGKCTAKFFNGNEWQTLELNENDGCILDKDLWREFEDFSDGAVLAAISNVNYDENLYIRDIEEYKNYINNR